MQILPFHPHPSDENALLKQNKAAVPIQEPGVWPESIAYASLTQRVEKRQRLIRENGLQSRSPDAWH
ncbi:uncharacterized [Tachysurus ichikawai]